MNVRHVGYYPEVRSLSVVCGDGRCLSCANIYPTPLSWPSYQGYRDSCKDIIIYAGDMMMAVG
ncbi:hypothetical protein E2C01_060784 [Portunus trituberculatus]|uniref:Uncharacterized protein n=1 Tax=Portunus trituberculatus TaxID=210409 RepID=A0A5B7HDA6_PORTR|nr:hypothetical protein [Portunus trituberculatus]